MFASRALLCSKRYLVLGFLLGATGACAGTIADTPQGRAAGEWNVRLPDTRSPIGSLAYGRGGNAEPAVVSEPAAPLALAPLHARRRIGPSRALIPALAPQAPAEPVAPQPLLAANAQLSFADMQTPTRVQDSETHERYAAREQQSPQQQEFRGGQVIIIGLGAVLVVVLVVVLLLILI